MHVDDAKRIALLIVGRREDQAPDHSVADG